MVPVSNSGGSKAVHVAARLGIGTLAARPEHSAYAFRFTARLGWLGHQERKEKAMLEMSTRL